MTGLDFASSFSSARVYLSLCGLIDLWGPIVLWDRGLSG